MLKNDFLSKKWKYSLKAVTRKSHRTYVLTQVTSLVQTTPAPLGEMLQFEASLEAMLYQYSECHYKQFCIFSIHSAAWARLSPHKL